MEGIKFRWEEDINEKFKILRQKEVFVYCNFSNYISQNIFPYIIPKYFRKYDMFNNLLDLFIPTLILKYFTSLHQHFLNLIYYESIYSTKHTP